MVAIWECKICGYVLVDNIPPRLCPLCVPEDNGRVCNAHYFTSICKKNSFYQILPKMRLFKVVWFVFKIFVFCFLFFGILAIKFLREFLCLFIEGTDYLTNLKKNSIRDLIVKLLEKIKNTFTVLLRNNQKIFCSINNDKN